MQIRRGTGLAIFWLAGSALGATYSYTRVVESSGSYFGQLYPPAVNNSGTVAFVSYAPGQGQGVFRSGESLVALTTSYSGYTFSKWLDISNNGDVIYRSGGYVFVNTNIVASGGSYDGDGVALNDAGQYVYPTNTAMIRSSIGDPSSSTVIGSRIGTDSQVPIRPSITPAGIISYSYTTLSGGYSYGVVSDGITKQNLFVGGPRDYASNVVDLTVNDSGQALYRGTRNVLGGTGLYYMEEFGQ